MKKTIIHRNGNPESLPFKLAVCVKQEQGDKKVINSHELEHQMDLALGWKLAEINFRGGTSHQIEQSRTHLKYFFVDYPDVDDVSRYMQLHFEKHLQPVCMSVESFSELNLYIQTVYKLMYFHYLLGKHYKLKNSFPHYCCGLSTYSLTLSLWSVGVVAAVATYDTLDDHAYVIVPFKLRESEKTGVILADPTSDQLHYSDDKKIRNHIEILPSDGWEYRTDWRGGSNLYPCRVGVSSSFGRKNVGFSEYMSEAMQNEVIFR